MADSNTQPTLSRRGALRTLAGSAAAGAVIASTGAATKAFAMSPPGGHEVFGLSPVARAADVFRRRVADARRYLISRPSSLAPNNGDETRFSDFRGSYSKALPHNDLGEVDPTAYQSLLNALRTGTPAAFDAIILDSTVRTRKLVSPQAGYRFSLYGMDAQSTRIDPAPAFQSMETAAEMLELYWKAICRDVPFSDYGSNPLIAAAMADMNAFPQSIGNPGAGGQVLSTLFRGETTGDRMGPYLSQFLWKTIPYGNGSIEQLYTSPVPGSNFMTNFADWLLVQRGGVTGSVTKGPARYIHDGRSLAEWVHNDWTYQAFLAAALILLGFSGDVLDPGSLLDNSPTQAPFVTFGGPNVIDMVGAVANEALAAAWYHKWNVHRRLRPEAWGGRYEVQRTGARNYGLTALLAQTDGLQRTFSAQGNFLFSQCFPEGSPTHTAYPAGHAAISGACTTVLKAFFNEDAPIQNPVVANADGSALLPFGGSLTIGGELDKLASNISLGRDWAGVHYRSDGIDGMLLGEQVAVNYLRDHSKVYNESFNGWELRLFNGSRIRIQNGNVFPL